LDSQLPDPHDSFCLYRVRFEIFSVLMIGRQAIIFWEGASDKSFCDDQTNTCRTCQISYVYVSCFVQNQPFALLHHRARHNPLLASCRFHLLPQGSAYGLKVVLMSAIYGPHYFLSYSPSITHQHQRRFQHNQQPEIQ